MPKQDQTKIISGKDLGQLALKSFCPRCFWIERKFGKAPSVFPGIFSTIDSLTKKSVRRSFAERSCPPDWLRLSNIKRVVEVSKLTMPIIDYGNWILTGNPDDVFELEDGTFHIVDYKTSKYTKAQDALLPMYQVQLNAYAYILSNYESKIVSKLSLIYCEPNENLDTDNDFKMSFTTNILEIGIDSKIVIKLLQNAREILNNEIPPKARFECDKICSWVNNFPGKLI